MAKKPTVALPPLPTRPTPDPHCDCLNICGDDPWVRDGRATPCPRFAAVRHNEQMQARLPEIRDKYRLELAQSPERQEFTVTRADLEALIMQYR
jgi:hypothetical protein